MKNFEGSLRPGRGSRKPSPNFEGSLRPGKIRVPRSPITNPRDLLPDHSDETDILDHPAVKAAIQDAEKNAYKRGHADGFKQGYDQATAEGTS